MLTTLSNLIYPSIAAFMLCGMLWLFFGRDPKNDDSVFARYYPMADLSVIEVAVLIDDLLQAKDFVYEMYDLYFKGIVGFEENNYVKLMKDLDSKEVQSLNQTQQLFLSMIFHSGIKTARLNSGSMKIKTARFREKVYDILKNKGFYNSSPSKQRRPYYWIARILITGGIIFNINALVEYVFAGGNALFFFLPYSLIVGLMFAGIIFGLFGRAMARKSEDGVKKLKEILGFREFLITAEEDRIKYFLTAEPEAYKHLIPYAFMFGVEEKWVAPVQNLKEKLIPKDLTKITFSINSESFERAFEEKHNFIFFFFNVIFYTIYDTFKDILLGKDRVKKNGTVFDDYYGFSGGSANRQLEDLKMAEDFEEDMRGSKS